MGGPPAFTGGGTVDYKYDPFGRRIYRSGPSGTTVWLYDGANIVKELDSTGTLQATYTQGSGVDEPLAMLRGTTTDYYEAEAAAPLLHLPTPVAQSPTPTLTMPTAT